MCLGKMKKIIVMKFGGSCLKDSNSFTKTFNIIERFQKEDTNLIFVCSAVSGITDYLLDSAKKIDNLKIEPTTFIEELEKKHTQIIQSVIEGDNAQDALEFIKSSLRQLESKYVEIQENGLSPQFLDFVLSFGERLSTYIFTSYLKQYYPTEFVSADDNFIVTSSNGLPIMDVTENFVKNRIYPLLSENIYPAVTGYIARSQDGDVTTLGRGGSDLTTTLVGACLQNEPEYSNKIILWKDVNGLYSSDPKLVSTAKLIPYISYAEARELAFFGTKILHPLSIFPAEQRNVPIEIRNFDDPDSAKFTTIGPSKQIRTEVVKAISVMKDTAMITVEGEAMVSRPGTAAKVFDLMGKNSINILMISQASSENNITFLVSRDEGEKAKDILINSDFFGKSSFFLKVKRELNNSLIAIVGAGMQQTPGVAGRICTALGKNNVNIRAIAQGSSELNISLVIATKDVEKAIQAIFNEFKL